MPEYSFLYSFFDRPDVLALMLAQLVARESYTVLWWINAPQNSQQRIINAHSVDHI
jgi:hypothetical protein